MPTADRQQKLEEAVWVAHSLFERGKTAGTTANISFLHEGEVFISASGTCFGTLRANQFAHVAVKEGIECLEGPSPSKELPLHLAFYHEKPNVGAVIHTHSTYCVLWSLRLTDNEEDAVPAYTPYLGMKLGKIAAVGYAPPGTKELFDLMDKRLGNGNGYLLKNHGPVVAGKNLMDAFASIEELEESCRIAWELRNEPGRDSLRIK